MRRPRPPTPMPARGIQPIQLWVSGAGVLLAVPVTVSIWLGGDPGRAMLAAAGILVVILGVAWVRGQTRAAPTVVAGFGVLGFAAGKPVFWSVIGVGFGLLMLRRRRLPDELRPETIVEVAPDAIGDGAEGFVADFASLGYRQVGAIGFPTDGRRIVESVMIGPRGDRWAAVTDAVLAVESVFDHGRLVTRNSGMTALPPEWLDNPLRGADPAELDRSHSEVLSRLAGSAIPVRLDPDTTTALALEAERSAVAWSRASARPVTSRSGLGGGPLLERPDGAALIAAWMSGNRPPASG